MNDSSARPADAIETVIRTYDNTLYRLSFVMLGSESDAEDAVQEAFIKYLQKAPQFENSDHEKAWLLTVAANQCRDILRFRKRHPQIDSEYLQGLSTCPSDSGILEALMSLPEVPSCPDALLCRGISHRRDRTNNWEDTLSSKNASPERAKTSGGTIPKGVPVMEFRELKQSVEKIEMTDAMQNRIIRNCRLSAVHETEEIIMKI